MPVRRFGEERGAAAVEFAIIGSLLLLILFGTITFGLIFNRYQGLQSSAREGARLGSLQAATRNDIIERVRDSVSVIQTSAISTNSCSPGTLSEGNGCVLIYAKQTPSATCPSSSCVEVASGSPSQTPCGAAYSGTDKSIVVEIYYRTRVDIPLWSSPQMTMKGGAEFKCEN
jgi:Flp pilus assembly protein TadG